MSAFSLPVWVRILWVIQATVRDHESVAVLHCHDDAPSENRELTHAVSDTVITVSRTVEEKTVFEYLDVPKHRYGTPCKERMKVSITDTVNIDNSRGY